jgi:hypothetical protein
VTISEHAQNFANKSIVDWSPEAPLTKPSEVVFRIAVDYSEGDSGVRWIDKFAEFLRDPLVGQVNGIVVGAWGEMLGDDETSAEIVEALVAAREKLTALTAIFMGDITYEECEISWINQTDISPLIEAYPALEHFRVRGGTGLSLGRLHHARLKSLVVETGGLNVEIVRQVMGAKLPELEHLELWLGTEEYGASASVQDLAPLFAGTLFPRLRYLGLRDSHIANEIAVELVKTPILERIRVLDLSLGTLSDTGAAALLDCPAVARLEKLDIHHHFCSSEMVRKLHALGITLDASEAHDLGRYGDEDSRYVAVGE